MQVSFISCISPTACHHRCSAITRTDAVALIGLCRPPHLQPTYKPSELDPMLARRPTSRQAALTHPSPPPHAACATAPPRHRTATSPHAPRRRHRRPRRSFAYAPAASPGTPHHSTTRCTGSPPSSMNAGHSMLLLLLFSPLAHPLVQAAPRAATRQLLTTVDTSSAQPTTISGARLPALALPRLARHSPHPRHSSPTPHPHSRPRKQGVNISKRG